MKNRRLAGFVAATHTPFKPDGTLNLAIVEAQAAHLLRNDIRTAFIGGSTGECHSLSLQERLQLTQRWVQVAHGTPMQIAVHVGSNCLGDSQALAAQAGELGVAAVAALAPCYFKPRNLTGLVEWCAAIAASAPQTPFYYYDIPSLTGVNYPMVDFLAQAADRIPTLLGIKFTSYDLFSYQLCLRLDDGAFDVLWGADEALLAALSLGGRNAIGTSYNYAAPVFHRLLRALRSGDLKGGCGRAVSDRQPHPPLRSLWRVGSHQSGHGHAGRGRRSGAPAARQSDPRATNRLPQGT